MNRLGWFKYSFAIALFFMLPLLAQVQPGDHKLINEAIEKEDFRSASAIFDEDVRYFLGQKNIDTLIGYVSLKGTIATTLHGNEKAAKEVFSFIDLLRTQQATPTQLLAAYREAADFFETTNQNSQAYTASSFALSEAEKLSANKNKEVARSEYNLGAYALRLGNVSLSAKHHLHAFALREANKNTVPEDMYLSCNAMGAVMWYASKYDSAKIYYEKALQALKSMPENDLNKYYRPASIYNNIAALYNAEGKASEGIEAMKYTILNFQKFISSKGSPSKKASAREGLYEAIDNLAGIYKELGDYRQAGDLLEYSYSKKKEIYSPGNPGIFISEILLGQHYNSIREYDKAKTYLLTGLEKLNKAEGDYLFWAGDAWYNLAMVYENTGDMKQAAMCYDSSESLYEQSYEGTYDNIYMDFMRNASLFYAGIGEYQAAYSKSQKVFAYLQSVGEDKNLQGFYQLLHIAEINYMAKRHEACRDYTEKALQILDSKMKESGTTIDSVIMESLKPKALLLRAKSLYALKADKDSAFLQSLSNSLDTALQILERRKVAVDDEGNTNLIVADHKSLINFAARINLELNNKSYSNIYLQKFTDLLESGLYNRIRSRIEQEEAIRFSGVPQSVLQEEKVLKDNIKNALAGKQDTTGINEYLHAIKQWEAYLDKIKHDFPVYYDLRYATLIKSLPDMQAALPAHTTLVRYYIIDSMLVAFIADKSERRLISLNYTGVSDRIIKFLTQNLGEKEQLQLLHELHEQIWKPVAKYVKTDKVMIIPDGVLYNLGFDMLPSEPVTHYEQLLDKSLLARYTFSYHYSMLMLNGMHNKVEGIKDNYVAFAPGFSDELKAEYMHDVKDSVLADRSYLTLLPQPGTGVLAQKIIQQLGGDLYLDDASTLSAFKKHAGDHKVIHIATHAIFDNLHPQQSGLVFAKADSVDDNNYLSLSDIYGCNMHSDLTLLTACESGRPGYQDGEGMVSLAHAFSYAGSKNIITALWKIDEQSSSFITEKFLGYVKEGMPTDEALRNAKLDYLHTARGRLVHPAYWSGLVLMGEPSVLELDKNTNYILIFLVAGIALGLIFLVWRLRKAR